MCETPERTAGFSPSTIALEDWWFLGARALYWLLSRRQKKKKKKKEDKISASKQFADSSMWLAFDKLHICTAPDTISIYVTLMLIPEWWIVWIIVPLLPLLGSRSAGTCWSHRPGVQNLGEKSMSPDLAAVTLPVTQAGTLWNLCEQLGTS